MEKQFSVYIYRNHEYNELLFLTITQVKQLIRQDKTITHCGCWLDDEGYDYTVGEGWTYYYKADSDADDINNYEGNWCLQIRVPAIEW